MNITELQLQTNCLSSQKEFYNKTLGLNILNFNDGSFSVNIGSSTLVFQETTLKTYYHFAVNIPENKIKEAIAWLCPRVAPIEHEGSPLINFKNWNAHSVYFFDAGGNIVELIARHNLDNSTDKLFGQSHFLCISEVGMPVQNVALFCSLIEIKLKEKLWSGNTETFAAVGDENGLFIIVTEKRNWFPTEIQSRSFPAKTKISSPQVKGAEIREGNYEISSE